MLTDLIPFLSKHWMLSSAFGFVLILTLWHEMLYRKQIAEFQFTPEQLVLQMNHHLVQLIDIRANDAYKASSILGAEHMTADQALKKLATHKKQDAKVVVLVGENGHDAAALAEKLRSPTRPIRYLAGGMQAWRDAQLPTKSKGGS